MPSLTYTLSTQPYYEAINQCYKIIIVIDRKPNAPLSNIVKTIQTPKLSPFQQASPCEPIKNCANAILNPETKELLRVDDLSVLFSYLMNNGYTIDTELTKMLNNTHLNITNKLICFITYTA